MIQRYRVLGRSVAEGDELQHVLREAYERLLRQGPSWIPTDDGEVYTRAGGRVRVVPLLHPNPKLTTVEDLEWARVLLSRRTSATA